MSLLLGEWVLYKGSESSLRGASLKSEMSLFFKGVSFLSGVVVKFKGSKF